MTREGGARQWLLGLLLIAGTLLAYQPAWHAGFVWDDHSHVERNHAIYGPGGLERIWFSRAVPQYYLLVFTSFWLERKLWGLDSAGFHWDNLLLQGLDAVLLWRLLRRLRIPGCWLAAAIFALHPVNVESAAWITERKNTLSLFFFLLTILWYLRAEENLGRQRRGKGASLYYWLALAAFLLALLSKTAVAPLPLVLLLCLWWQRGGEMQAGGQSSRPSGTTTGGVQTAPLILRDVLRILPFLALALALVPITILFEHQAGSEAIRQDPFLSRFAAAGYGFWFYLYKALLPINLCFVYPQWGINGTKALAHLPGALAVVAFLVWGRYWRGWGRPWLFAMGYFALMLLPELGFVNIYAMRFTPVSDHWQYFAIVCPIALVAAGIAWVMQRWTKRAPWTRIIAYSALLLALGALTWSRSRIFSDDETLWESAVTANPSAWMAHNNLGICLMDKPGQLEQAQKHFRESLRLNPQQHEPHLNLGVTMMKAKEWERAKAEFEAARALAPNHPMTYNDLGLLAEAQGRPDEAQAYFRHALELYPDYGDAHNNLGASLKKQGKTRAAAEEFTEALRLNPELVSAHDDLGLLLRDQGQTRQAMVQFREALAIDPHNAEAHNNLGVALADQRELSLAQVEFTEAVRLNPASADAQHNLGNLLLIRGLPAEAATHCAAAIAARPDFPGAHLTLGRALSALGKPDEAAQHFSEALRLNSNLAEAHYWWANLLASRGAKDEALSHYPAALQIQPNYAEAHYQLGALQAGRKQRREAVAHFREALRQKPNWADALNNLAWILGTDPDDHLRSGAEAVRLAERACEITDRRETSMLDTLAAAYAEAGRFDDALRTTEEISALARSTGDAATADTARQRAELYKAGKPYRDK